MIPISRPARPGPATCAVCADTCSAALPAASSSRGTTAGRFACAATSKKIVSAALANSTDKIDSTLANVDKFSGVLANNADRFDHIAQGLENLTGGKDGNTHFGDLGRGLVAPISMLGALIPVMAGVALAGLVRELGDRLVDEAEAVGPSFGELAPVGVDRQLAVHLDILTRSRRATRRGGARRSGR